MARIFYNGIDVRGTVLISGSTAWHSGNLTNLSQLTNGPGYLTGITSGQVMGALGFTPYNNTNPSGYITGSGNTTGTAGSTTKFMSSDYAGTYWMVHNWDGSRWYCTTNHGSPVRVGYADSAGSAPIQAGVWTSSNLTNLNQLTNGPGYLTGITSGQVTGALGFTPYNNTNPSGYITGSGNTTGSAQRLSDFGSTNNWDTDFANTPTANMRYAESSAGGPGGTWWFQQNFRHSNGSNYWGTQIAWGWEDNANRVMVRGVSAGSYGSWRPVHLNGMGDYATFGNGISVVGGISVGAGVAYGAGDIGVSRSGGTTGVIYFNAADDRYLYYDGTYYSLPAASLIVNGTTYSSSRTVKNNIRDWTSGKSNRLRVRQFERKDSPTITELGFVAEEVQVVFPEAIKEGALNPNDSKAPRTPGIDPMAIIAKHELEIQELQDQIAELRKRGG